MKLFGFDADESVAELFAQAEGLKTLPKSAAGHKQKPVDDFGWKPSEEETRRDIEADKILAPIQREVFMKAFKERTEVQEYSVPSEDEMIGMSWEDLLHLRKGATTKEQQNKIAPYEHRAWAREYVKDNPEAALILPGLIMGYNAAKAIGLKEGRSDASAAAILEGLKGTIEGIGGKARELLE